jgi:hypothetical protein
VTRIVIHGGNYNGWRGDQAADGSIVFDQPTPEQVWPDLPFHPARAAADFRASVGVNVHISYTDTSYGDLASVKAALAQLGVKHVRDGACAGCTSIHPRQRQIADELGVRYTWIAGDPRNTTGTVEANIGRVQSDFADCTDALENPNEWDVRGGQWAAELRTYAAGLRSARDMLLPGVSILAPSLVRAASRATLGDLSAYVDRGNMHSYPGAVQPDAGALTNELALAEVVAPGRAPCATETGYHNATQQSGRPGISEAAAAGYLPRLYLEYFRRGVERTFLYELAEQRPDPLLTNPELHFGLFRSDWTAKPAVTEIRKMLDQAGDGRPTLLNGLAYQISAPVTVRDLLLQRADGGYTLALWRTAALWDPKLNGGLGGDVGAGSKTAIVTFGQPTTAGRQLQVPLAGSPVYVDIEEMP